MKYIRKKLKSSLKSKFTLKCEFMFTLDDKKKTTLNNQI